MSIYDLPWYLLIGEPQSGKSTTLKNSGLEFPVGADGALRGRRHPQLRLVVLQRGGDPRHRRALHLPGGERPRRPASGRRFLKLLKKHRKYCPINGVIVVIPATCLVEDTPDEQERKAKNIRAKLLHLQKVLEIRFPVFVLVTKADRILGFSEFFTKLDPADQRQLFGWSNPEPDREGVGPQELRRGVSHDIVNRVHKLRCGSSTTSPTCRRSTRCSSSPRSSRPSRSRSSTTSTPCSRAAATRSRSSSAASTSRRGIQQGRPIARACRDLLRVSVGDPQGVLENLEQVFRKSRAFFIRDFYEKKAFQEQGLIARTRAALRSGTGSTAIVLYGLGAVVIPLLVFALGTAAFNLYTRLRPDRQGGGRRPALPGRQPALQRSRRAGS